jgi:hypothetical protein
VAPFPAGIIDFSPLHRVQSGFGPHSVSYKMGTEGYFQGGGGKQQRHSADPCAAAAEREICMQLCHHSYLIKQRDNFVILCSGGRSKICGTLGSDY